MNTVIFLTTSYPYGSGEEFIENEIEILANKFDKVVLIATEVDPNARTMRELPNNTISLRINREEGSVAKLGSLFVMIGLYLSGKAYKGDFKSKRKYYERKFILRMEERSWRIWNKIKKSRVLDDIKIDKITIYSYWLLLTARVGVFIKEQSGLQIKRMISRAHGYDLYEERSVVGFLPYRKLFLREYDIIATCSQNGAVYLSEFCERELREKKENIYTGYLGTCDYGVKETNTSDILYLVSCSSLIPLKRVERIANTLLLLDKTCQIYWTHIGDGPTRALIDQRIEALPSNIKVNLAGTLSNQEVMEFYRNAPIDLFINVSSTEGVPVSIMEALSFGIPVIATNVGGVSEMIQDGKNGYLLRCDFTDSELAELITKFMSMKKKEQYVSFRKNARETWERQFNAQVNYNEFWDRNRG